MASLVRRMQRTLKREKRSGKPNFGTKLGVRNPRAKDLLARQARAAR